MLAGDITTDPHSSEDQWYRDINVFYLIFFINTPSEIGLDISYSTIVPQ